MFECDRMQQFGKYNIVRMRLLVIVWFLQQCLNATISNSLVLQHLRQWEGLNGGEHTDRARKNKYASISLSVGPSFYKLTYFDVFKKKTLKKGTLQSFRQTSPADCNSLVNTTKFECAGYRHNQV